MRDCSHQATVKRECRKRYEQPLYQEYVVCTAISLPLVQKEVSMRLTRQARIFARQVQVDLLALSNSDLFQIVHSWVSGEHISPASQVSEEVRSALGYTFWRRESSILLSNNLTGYEGEVDAQWLAPTPQHLRSLLEEMDTHSFAASVLPLAFEALHSTHPEWGEAGTFHAHLANYLRRVRGEQRV